MRHFQLCLVLFGFGFITVTNSQYTDATLNSTLSCSGIPLTDVSNLKGFTDATFDLYTALRSKVSMSPNVSSVIDTIRAGSQMSVLLNDLTNATTYFNLKLNPYLPSSLPKETLFCLSQGSLSCDTFQFFVRNFDTSTSPERKKMVYQNFIKSFLTRNDIDVRCSNTSDQEWLLQNFHTFSTFATYEDFLTLKPDFNGVNVVTQLTPEQRAELTFNLLASGTLNNDTAYAIFSSFLNDLQNVTLNLTIGNSDGLSKNLTDFLVLLKPFGRFVKSSVNKIINTPSLSNNVTQLLNLTLSYLHLSVSVDTILNAMNSTNITDWTQNIIIPVVQMYLASGQTLPSITSDINSIVLATDPPLTDPAEICTVPSSNSTCRPAEQFAKALNCFANSNLIVSEENLRLLIAGLNNKVLTAASQSNGNSSSLSALYGELPADSFSSENLVDVDFVNFWFQIKMIPLLPTVSGEYLSCLSTREFSCQVYRQLVAGLSNNSALMGNPTQRLVYNNLIRPFLTRRLNTSGDCTLNNSVDFILQNFGSFSAFAQLQDFYNLSLYFSALDAIPALSVDQLSQLVFTPPAGVGDRNEVLRRVFDFLLQPSNRDKLINFLPFLQTQARLTNFSCENYRTIFDRIDQTLSSLLPNQTDALLTIRDSIMMIPPDECILRDSQCAVIPVNEAVICASVNSSALSQFLNTVTVNATGSLNVCNFSVQQFACLPMVSRLSTQQVADLLACSLSSNVTKDTWKLFFSKLGTQLDDALQRFTNTSQSPRNVSLSSVMDVIVEVRIDRLSPQRLRDPAFIDTWMQGKLRPFLPSLSQGALSCITTKNFSCESYRAIFMALNNNNTGPMGNPTQELIYTNFIRPFLTQRLNSGGDCTLPFNNSLDFILQNFGVFSHFAQLQDYYNLSSSFSALDALSVLTPMQLKDLVFTPPPRVGDRNEVLRRVFDFLLQPSNRDKLNNFLPSLQTQARPTNFSCENYRNIFDRIDQTLSSLLPNQTDALLTIRDSIMMIPPDECILRASQCAVTPVNETIICASVNSSALSQFLNTVTVNATGSQTVCNFSVQQFACLPTVSRLSTQQVADLLACSLSSNVTKDTWKLFFSKLGTQLDDALQRFTNTSQSPRNVSLSSVMDVIVEVRIDRLSPQRLRDPAFVDTWMQGKLRPFLPSLSQAALSCITTKNFSCESYRAIFMALNNNNTGPMGNPTQELIYTNFIRPFLTQRLNSGGDCTLPFNNSLDFILQNFGVFSPFAQLQDYYNLSSSFSALDALSVLTLMQLNDLVFTPPARVGDRNEVLRRVFDFLLQPSNRDKLINFLPSLQKQARPTNFSCENYRNIFDRIDQTLSSLLPNQTDALLTIRDSIMMIPPDECILRASQCAVIPVNEAVICASVNSSALSQFLNTVTVNATGSLNVCNFSVQQFACLPTGSRLRTHQVADLLACSLSSNVTKDTWKLFFSKLGTQLDDALQRFTNTTQIPRNVSLSSVMDVIVEVRIDRLSPQRLRDPAFVDTWMQGKLRPFLPSLSQGALSCITTKNFSCESYRAIFMALNNNNTGPMGNPTQRLIYTNFIHPFLTQRLNSGGDCTLPFNNSLDFILQNFGVFSPFAQLQDFYNLSSNFAALDALSVLTPMQLNDLVFTPPARVGDRNEVLRRVFDFLLQPSNRDKLINFLPPLQTKARPTNFSCENYRNIFDRIDQTLSSVLPNQTDALLTIRDSIMMIPPDECILRASQCAVIPVNEAVICASVNSSALSQFLNTVTVNATGSLNVCNFSVQQFACLPMGSSLSTQQVADLLACSLSTNVTKDTWKLFFSKLGTQLDDALQRFTNTTQIPRNVSLSSVMDVIVEVRIDRLSPQRLRDPAFVDTWMQGKLRPFLPSLSQAALSCITTKNFSCESYRAIFMALNNNNTGPMGNPTQELIYTNFIRPFLTQRLNSGGDCTLPFNNSLDFILQNFGIFSPFAQLQDFYNLSSSFSALDALSVLTPMQLNDLVFTPPARAGDRNEILRRVFDFLLQPSNRDKLINFLPSLQTQARPSNFSCENYRNIFDRIDQTLSSLLPNQTDALLTIRDSIMMIPPDECILRDSQCAVTPVNETVICASVNSSALSQFLNTVTVNATGSLNVCNFSVQQFACLPTISRLNPQQVADLLACSLSSNVTKDTWKLFFSKLGTQLDDALQRFTYTSQSPSHVSLSSVMDVIVEVRIDRLSPQRLRDPAFVDTWMQGKLRPFLPSLSQAALSCITTKNFSCESYRAIFMALNNNNTGPMGNPTQELIYTNFIRPFLTQRLNSGGDCTLPFNNSLDFILQNFGVFSPFAQLQDFYNLSSSFSALDALSVLTPMQLNDLVFTPPARAGDRNEILRRVFDFLLQPSNRDKLINFLPSLQTQARPSNFSCENYRNIFDRIDQTLSSLLPNQTDALLTIRDSIMMIPPDECILRDSQCAVTPVNETIICASVNSSALSQFLNTVTVNAAGSLNVCNFSVQQFACLPMISRLNPQQVADLLACSLSTNVTKDIWKLFFSKLGTQLDDALQRFTNTSQSPSNIFLSSVMDVIVEVRIDRLSPQRLRDPAFVDTWVQGKLRPFLPSQGALSCLSTKNFSCESYRAIFMALNNNNTGPMGNPTQELIYTNFIRPFLTQRLNSGGDCTLPFINSLDFILQNFGIFSPLAQLQDFYNLGSNFSALDALSVLTPMQLNDSVFTPPARVGDRNEVLRRVFDFLLQPSNRDKLINFLPSLQTQARPSNFSCENYRNIFDRIDQTLSSLLPNQTDALLTIRDSIMMIPPDECILRASQCAVTPVNETVICSSVNSSALSQFLNTVTVNATGSLNVCNFSVQQFACLPTVSRLTTQQVADLLACSLSTNVTKDIWKLFFSKLGTQLDDALQRFTNMAQSPINVSLSDILDVIVDVRIDRLSPQRLKDPAFIGTWFQGRLTPFLPSLSQGTLSCLSTKNLTCETYRRIVGAFVNVVPQDGQDVCKPLQSTTITQRQDLIYTQFINAFLSRNDTDDPRCLRDSVNTSQWLARNFGPFARSARLMALQTLNRNFSAVEVLPSLTVSQLSEFAATPGSLTDPSGVNTTMQYVKDCQLGVFFDLFSPAVQGVPLTQDVKTTLIQQIFNRANLSNVNTSNDEVLSWINTRLNPLLTNLTDSLVTPLFGILGTRDCNITQAAVNLLDVVRPSMPNNTKNAVYNNILLSFRGPAPLRCYRNNSFIAFLNGSLLGFGPLPNVTTLLSLIPPPRITEIVNSVAPPELGNYLAQPNVVDGDTEICVIFKNLVKTPVFLETVDVPDNVKSMILPCVWPLALSSDNQTEIDLWFDRRLRLYLQFLNMDILGSNDTMNASCQSYKKMVNVLGSPSFNSSQLNSTDIYNSAIKTYLTTDSQPKCFSVNDPRLNSTSWFVDYISVNFISFVSIDDLYSFGPETTMKQFSVNPDNIKLFNQPGISKKVLSRYTELIFLQNVNFDLFSLPSTLQCDAPVSVFTNINENQTNVILANFKTSCSDVDPQISAVLVGKLPKTINSDIIKNLGQESVGLTTVQITNADPSVIIDSLSTLGNATGWNLGQAQAIITVILNGNFQLNSSSSLLSLGSLIGGIPSEKLTAIAPQQILETSRDETFIKNILVAPEIIQMTYVTQIITISTSVSALMENVPSAMALQIPRNLLIIPPNADENVKKQFNHKKWKPEQAVLFFDTVADAFNDTEELSVDVLQGFTCARVQTLTVKALGFVKACRHREGRPKVVLSESQLTCMYNLVKNDLPLDFVNYPRDMLLYYNYNAIPSSNCTSYFTQVGLADFSVLSTELQGKRDTLWSNAQDCLKIVGTSIKKTELAVLGNLVCAASKDYILNSDPEILENLKKCKDLSDLQLAAMETVLLAGNTTYGPPSTWDQKTLADLGNLPLYFSQKFWASFKSSDLAKFLKTFLKSLRDNNTPKPRMKRLFNALIVTTTAPTRAGETCTKGNITNVEISDDAFPFGYTATQFKLCMSAQVASEHLAALCEKIDISDFQRIILDKLNEISPNGLSESQVKVLGAVSRNATLGEINKWNITKADTLGALMDANNGEWTTGQSNLIITKYLNANNNLTATELNLVKGPNLCSLNSSTLSSISPDSIKGADALDVTKCSSDNKKALFSVAKQAFPLSSTRASSAILRAFQLTESYIGGADLAYIKTLAGLNVTMSLTTFMKLDTDVVKNLTVSDVRGLLGVNLQDLKTYENQTTVQSWIQSRLQSELDALNISLTGGKVTASPTTSSVVTNATTVTVAATTPKTPSSGAPGIRPSKWSLSFTIIVLIFTIIKVEITEHR